MPPYKAPPVRRKPRRRDVKRAISNVPAVAHYAQRTVARQRLAGVRGSINAYHAQDRNPAQVVHRRRTQAKQKRAYRQDARRYVSYTEDLWGKAGRYYPSRKRPDTRHEPLALNIRGDLSYGVPLAYVLANKPPGKRAIHVTPATVYGLNSPNRTLRDYAHSVPLHEWAHVFQSDATLHQPRSVYEGAAEALEQLLAPKVGLRSVTNSTYGPWARRAKKRGRSYVLHDQFGDY